jgi:hypothetical protein
VGQKKDEKVAKRLSSVCGATTIRVLPKVDESIREIILPFFQLFQYRTFNDELNGYWIPPSTVLYDTFLCCCSISVEFAIFFVCLFARDGKKCACLRVRVPSSFSFVVRAAESVCTVVHSQRAHPHIMQMQSTESGKHFIDCESKMLTETEGTTSSMILPTRILVQKDGSSDGIECSAHTMPKPLQREFRHVFGDSICFPIATDSSLTPLWPVDNNLQDKCEILAIPTNQKAREDLVAVGEHIEREKDRLLHVVRLDMDYSLFTHLYLINVSSTLCIIAQCSL